MPDTQFIIQLGLGKVGQELLRQVLALWEQERALHLNFIGLGDRSGLLYNPDGFYVDDIEAVMAAKLAGRSGEDAEVEDNEGPIRERDLLSLMRESGIKAATFVDLTTRTDQLPLLTAARAAGHNLVFANKAPFAIDYASYLAIAPTLPGEDAPKGWGRVKHEPTVGAGLPVISTLEGLLASGDRIARIEASVSGTLGYICAALDEGFSFSAAQRRAHDLGYTEPDPRDDLNGLDAARKALILARRMGLPLELGDVAVESLVPAGLESVVLDDFWAKLPQVDATYRGRLEAARKEGKVLRYVALIEDGQASVGLRGVAADSPLGRLRGSDSIFIWHTTRYSSTPLVVQGPGAGPQVTAAGVLADILSLAN